MTDSKTEFINNWLAQAYEQPDISIEFQALEPYRDELKRTGISITMETLQSIDSQDDDDILNPGMGTDHVSVCKEMCHTVQQDTGATGLEDHKSRFLHGPTIFAPLPQQQMIRLEECAVAEKEDEDGYEFPINKVSVAELMESLPKEMKAKLPEMLMRHKVLRGNKTGPVMGNLSGC